MTSLDYLERLERDMSSGLLHLLVLMHLRRDQPIHGYGLIKAMDASGIGQGTWKEGTVYPLLNQMERDGIVQARWGEGGTGARRKYYELTASGRQALRIGLDHWRQLEGRMARLAEDVE